MAGTQHFSQGDNQFQLVYDRGQCADSSYLKVIRFNPLAPVKTTVLLLPMEWKMPDFINNIEKL